MGILRELQINYSSKASADGYFNLTSDIFLKSVLQPCWKIRRPNHRAKQWKIWSFLHDFNNLRWTTKTGDGGAGWCICSKTLQFSGKLKRKLQAAVPVLCWYFFNLNEITVVKKVKCMTRIFISSFERE